MDAQIFQIANTIALLSWVILIAFPYKPWTGKVIIGATVTVLAIVYSVLVLGALRPEDMQNFNSLDGVKSLFSDDQAVLAGWIHYLAFDLMAGWFITRDAIKYQINRYLLIPALVFTFMLGPFGLLLYFILRTIKTRGQHFLD